MEVDLTPQLIPFEYLSNPSNLLNNFLPVDCVVVSRDFTVFRFNSRALARVSDTFNNIVCQSMSICEPDCNPQIFLHCNGKITQVILYLSLMHRMPSGAFLRFIDDVADLLIALKEFGFDDKTMEDFDDMISKSKLPINSKLFNFIFDSKLFPKTVHYIINKIAESPDVLVKELNPDEINLMVFKDINKLKSITHLLISFLVGKVCIEKIEALFPFDLKLGKGGDYYKALYYIHDNSNNVNIVNTVHRFLFKKFRDILFKDSR